MHDNLVGNGNSKLSQGANFSILIMKPGEIEEAFRERNVIDCNAQSFDFEDLACSVVALRDKDMLNLIPSLMIYVLENKQNKCAINYAEMIVFCLMPQPEGWSNIIESMNLNEISATLKWLKDIKDCSFVENCADELQLATDLFANYDWVREPHR